MRLRLVVALATVLVAVAVVAVLSRHVVLNAGSDHIVPASFVATVPRNAELCQLNPYLPAGARSAQIVVATNGRPVPAFALRFLTAAGAVVASGSRPAGAGEGPVSIPIVSGPDAANASRLCLRVRGPAPVLVAGRGLPPDQTDEIVNGRPQLGRISVVYRYGGGPKAWWSQLSAIDHRFGLGKASVFGDSALPPCALLLLAAWALALRLLLRAES
jgi:hypothetical protein